MRILGLDASSTTIGWGCLDFDDQWNLTATQIGFIKPPKADHIVEKLRQTRVLVNDLMDQLKPDRVVLEEILLQHPKTTIKTLATLAIFNRSVCLWVYDKLEGMPDLFTPLKIRHAIKLTKGREVPKKEEIPALMEHHLGKLFWPVVEKGKYKGSRAEECGDIADGLACAFALKVIIQREIAEQKKRNLKRDKKRSLKSS